MPVEGEKNKKKYLECLLNYTFYVKVNEALQCWNEIFYTFYPGRYTFGMEGDSCGSSL